MLRHSCGSVEQKNEWRNDTDRDEVSVTLECFCLNHKIFIFTEDLLCVA